MKKISIYILFKNDKPIRVVKTYRLNNFVIPGDIEEGANYRFENQYEEYDDHVAAQSDYNNLICQLVRNGFQIENKGIVSHYEGYKKATDIPKNSLQNYQFK